MQDTCELINYGEVSVLSIINPRRACAARVTVVVLCVCVCLSATILALHATRRYKQLQCYKGKITNVAILLNPVRSGDMA